MVDLHQLKQFLCVAEYGTVSKAAEELNITQPALSRSLQNLECELDVSLFARTKNKIVLTETGVKTVKLARKLLSEAESFEKNVKDYFSAHSTIQIGSCAPCKALKILEDSVKEFFPNIKCSSEIEEESKLSVKLLKGKYQLALLSNSLNDGTVEQVAFYKEQLFAMIPKKHALAKKTEGIYFSDIDGEAIIPFPLKGYWNDLLEKSLPHSQFLYQKTLETFDKIVNATNLISFSSDAIPMNVKNHVAIPVLDASATITYNCACLKSSKKQFSPVLRKLKG